MKRSQWQNIFQVIPNVNSLVQNVIQKIKWNNKTCQCECKNYRNCKKITLEILAHVFVRIAIT